jgi:hypothetical protein
MRAPREPDADTALRARHDGIGHEVNLAQNLEGLTRSSDSGS